MKKIVFILILYLTACSTYAQQSVIDSLEKILPGLQPDSQKVAVLVSLGQEYFWEELYQEAKEYSREAAKLSEKIKADSLYIESLTLLTRSFIQLQDRAGADSTLQHIKTVLTQDKKYKQLGNVYLKLIDIFSMTEGEQVQYYFRALQAFEMARDTHGIASTKLQLGFIYMRQKNYPEAEKNYLTAKAYFQQLRDTSGMSAVQNRLSMYYRHKKEFMKALQADSTGLRYSIARKDTFSMAWVYASLGRSHSLYATYLNPSNPDKDLLQQALENATKAENLFVQIRYPENTYPRMKMMALQGSILAKLKKWKEASVVLMRCLTLSTQENNEETLKDAHQYLVSVDSARGDFKGAFEHLKKFKRLEDISNTAEDVRLTTSSLMKYETDKTLLQIELENAKQEAANKRTRLLMLGGILLFLLTTLFFFINNRQKQKSKKQVETAYAELKNTQSQLIHAEKMASLGELTAGIAHEIQNPLNFVNNFSEVNAELVDELMHELTIGNVQLAKEIAGNIKENEEKILHHGKRADSIVKGMLMHSRTSSGTKVPTELNVLVDEYVRLAYHGMRAKDKSFNVDLQTRLSKDIGLLNLAPQDIGRVVLNLLTNAFYAVSEKAKAGNPDYKPVVSVSTARKKDQIELIISDNGTGMSPKVVEKIFQPFFTTKSVGSGTGLGLSISYDIIKAHGGEILVSSKEGEGTQFTLLLPNV